MKNGGSGFYHPPHLYYCVYVYRDNVFYSISSGFLTPSFKLLGVDFESHSQSLIHSSKAKATKQRKQSRCYFRASVAVWLFISNL